MPTTNNPDPVDAAAFGSAGVRDAAAVDEAWLTSALRMPANVVSFEATSIGTGQVGENVRYLLTWDSAFEGLPNSVVGKFPALDVQSRETAQVTGAYAKEIGFYRDLADTVDTATPAIYFLAQDLEANSFTLLMEDIGWGRPGNQLEGCTPTEAADAVTELARLHGPHWGSKTLNDLDWIEERSSDASDMLKAMLEMVIDGFCDRYSQRLTPEVLVAARWIVANFSEWSGLSITPMTLTHSDYRLDNLMFADSEEELPEGQVERSPVTVVDWQTAGIGHGPTDLAYFLGASMWPEDRREAEQDLLADYRVELQLDGVSVSAEDVWHDYRVGSASGLIMAILASQIVGQTERGDEMFCVMAERHAAQMSDVDLATLLRD